MIPGKKRAMPAAQKKDREHGGGNEHIGVFGQEKEGKTHSRILGMKPGNQFRFGLHQVKGGPVGFGRGGDEKDDGGNGLIEDIPDRRLGRRRFRSF